MAVQLVNTNSDSALLSTMQTMASASSCSSPLGHLPAFPSAACRELGPKNFVGQTLPREIALGVRQHRPWRVSAYLADSVTESVTDVLRRIGVDPTERRLSLVLAIGAQAGRRTEDGTLAAPGGVRRSDACSRVSSPGASWTGSAKGGWRFTCFVFEHLTRLQF